MYTFINPNEKEEVEQQATQAGVQPVMINVRDKDQMKQQKAYLGAVVQMGERTEVIPFMQPGAAMEYALASSVKKLSSVQRGRAGVQGREKWRSGGLRGWRWFVKVGEWKSGKQKAPLPVGSRAAGKS